MGMKLRRGPRATKVPVRRRTPSPGDVGADPCAGTWEFWATYSPQLAPYIALGSDVSLYPKDGRIAVMIGTREIGMLTDPAVPQIVDCMDWGYIFTGSVIEISDDASRVRLRVSGTLTTEHT